MGPRDGRKHNIISYIVLAHHLIADSLGGDVHYSLGLSVISNIPKKPHWPVKSHVWVNCGQLDSLDRSKFDHLHGTNVISHLPQLDRSHNPFLVHCSVLRFPLVLA